MFRLRRRRAADSRRVAGRVGRRDDGVAAPVAFCLLVIGNLVWLVPLFWLSGGIVPYMKASRELARLAVMPTSIFTMNPIAVTQNSSFDLAGIVVGVNLSNA